MADKTPIRGAYNASSALTGLAEYATSETVGVPFGGTGATSLTDDGILLGNAAAAVQATAALTTNGQVVVGGTSGPAVANIAGTTDEVDITNGDGTITVGLSTSYSPAAVLQRAVATGKDITAKTAENANKIILVDLTDPATMWDVEAFLAATRFTSWRVELGAPPMRGAIFLNNAKTELHWWNLDTDAAYMQFDVGGSNNDDNNMIYLASNLPSCIAFLDGKIYFGLTGGGAWFIDLLQDECIGWFASGQRRYEGNIEERNDGKGNVSTRTSVTIINNTVNGVAAGRDTTLTDEFNRPIHWWSVGTAGGACIYNPHNDAIYDWHDTSRASGNQLLMNDKWLFTRNQTTYWGMNWVQMSGVDADNVAVEQHFNPWNSADGTNRYQYSIPWDKSATISGIAANSDANQVYVASDEGLCQITFPTEDNMYGWIWTTSTYQTPYMKGERVVAYPLNDLNDRSKGTGQTLTNNNSVTFAAGGPTGNYADFVAASSQSLEVADHANFGGMAELVISCWFKRDIDSGAAEGIVSKYQNGVDNDSFVLNIHTDDTLYFGVDTSTGESGVFSDGSIAVGRWYHAVGVYDGVNIKLYIDGVLVKSSAYTGTVDNSSGPLLIGAVDSSGGTPEQLFDGQIAGVFIGATAMTETEVKLEYDRGLRVLSGATAKLANTDVKSVRVDPDTGLAAVTTAANQVEIWNVNLGLRESINATSTATLNDADVRLPEGADEPLIAMGRSGQIGVVAPDRRLLG